MPILRRLPRTLLFYLASQPEPVSRAQLMLLFWPDATEQVGRQRLREALSKLRSQLDNPRYWIVDNDSVGLNFDNVWVDALQFLQAFNSEWRILQQTPRNVPLPGAVYQRVRDALELWRSPRLLPGVTLYSSQAVDDWLSAVSQRYESMRVLLLERLAYHEAAQGDLLKALELLRQALETDELNEDLLVQALTWLRTLGMRAELAQACEHIIRLYAEETGGPPPDYLVKLCQQNSKNTHQPPSRNLWPAPERMHLPFVGRVYAMEQLDLLYKRGGAAIVLGEAGAGKTRLMQHFVETRAFPTRLLLAQSHSAESSLPFQPVIEMLRTCIHEDEWRRLDPVWLAALAPLMPELLRFGTPPQPMAASRAHIFEALRQLLLSLDEGERILMVLDDAQWSDQATLQALAYLQERGFFERRGLLVVCARGGEPGPALEEYLSSAHAEEKMPHFPLRQLSQDEIGDLVRHVLDQEPPSRLVQRLAHDTGGNPLFIIETLRAWLDIAPRPPLEAIQKLPPPESIQKLLHERLRKCTSHSRAVLQAAAVIGHRFTPEMLEQVTGLADADVVAALEELEHRYLVQPDEPSGSAAYVFIHDKFREVLLKELTPARRRLLHQRTAQALQSASDGLPEVQAAVLAEHFEAAGDTLRAFRLWLDAAAHARSLFSYSEVSAAYRRADDLLPHLEDRLREEDLYALYEPWGVAATEVSDMAAMRRVYASMQHLGERYRSRLLLGEALSGLGYLALLRRDLADSLDLLQRSLSNLRDSGNRLAQIRAYIRQGNIYMMSDRFEDASQSFQRAIELGAGSDDPQITPAVLLAQDWYALTDTLRGWPQKSAAMVEQALRAPQYQSPSFVSVRSMFTYCTALTFSGRFREGLEYARKGVEITDRMGLVKEQGMLHFLAGLSAISLLDMDTTWHHGRLALVHAEETGYNELVQACWVVLANLYGVGDLAQAIAIYEKVAPAKPNSMIDVFVLYRLARARALNGELQRGRELVDQLLDFTGRVGLYLVHYHIEVTRALILRLEGDAQQAEAILTAAMGEAHVRGLQTTVLEGELELVEVYLAQGHWEKAASAAHRLAQSAGALEARQTEVEALVLLARALRAAGLPPDVASRERALALLDQAAERARLPEVMPYFERWRESMRAQLG